MSKKKIKVLVTGSEGYIGSVLVPTLIANGYEVTGLDTCFFSDGNLTQENIIDYPIIIKDIRNVESKDLEGFDAIIHLAALSNDPLGMLDEQLTLDINYKATVRLAELAKKNNISKFIFFSSCSLYGQSDNILTELDLANPQTAYGKSKILSENALKELADSNFSPVYMRNATAFGLSPRMRFDLVVNSLEGFAKTTGLITILGDGKPWRPLVHIKDMSELCIHILKTDKSIIHNQSFNVGDSIENYQVKVIAEKVQSYYSDCKIEILNQNPGDTRNYKVSFDKLNNILNYKTKYTLDYGLNEIKNGYDNINLNYEVFNSKMYNRLTKIKYLIENNLINNNLFWK